MSDLRTRIARAICGAIYGHNTRETAWADLHEDAQDEYLAEADAVIAELGLQKQSQTGEIVNIIEGDNINYSRHRYVTEWAADD